MIDIKAIRKKSENGDELKRLRTHVINAINTAADTDSVKLPESCPEVAQTCNTCRWYNVTRIPPCDMGNKPENPNVQGCNLYESED